MRLGDRMMARDGEDWVAGSRDKGSQPAGTVKVLDGGRVPAVISPGKSSCKLSEPQRSFYIWQLRCTSVVVLSASLVHCIKKEI